MRTKVSPMFLTYHMLKWEEVEQHPSDQVCTLCGKQLSQTEDVADARGDRFVGYVCHSDRQVTWVRTG